jgi:septal ring factor EnvC (AmiA/AmiB activator)
MHLWRIFKELTRAKTAVLNDYTRPVVLLIGLVLTCFTAGVDAQNGQDHKKNIDSINLQIKKLTDNLNANKSLIKSSEHLLFKTEKEISQIRRKFVKQVKQIEEKKRQEFRLSGDIDMLLDKSRKEQEALQTLLVSRYKQGTNTYLQVLLNQQNPYAVGRVNNYYNYFSKAVQRRIQEARKKLQFLEQQQQLHRQIVANLETDKKELEKHVISLEKARNDRQKKLSVLNREISKDNKKIKKLKRDKERLQTLVEEIDKQVKRQQEALRKETERKKTEIGSANSKPVVNKTVQGGFIKQRGRLNCPIQAKKKYSFGQRISGSGLIADGNFYETKGSRPVKSIFRGRVVFSDFLKGYGLLLIIDHGDNHISLYGHNELVYKTVGDTVVTGEVVSKSGVSGGLKQTGLYFEIRNGTTPIDPAKWCR